MEKFEQFLDGCTQSEQLQILKNINKNGYRQDMLADLYQKTDFENLGFVCTRFFEDLDDMYQECFVFPIMIYFEVGGFDLEDYSDATLSEGTVEIKECDMLVELTYLEEYVRYQVLNSHISQLRDLEYADIEACSLDPWSLKVRQEYDLVCQHQYPLDDTIVFIAVVQRKDNDGDDYNESTFVIVFKSQNKWWWIPYSGEFFDSSLQELKENPTKQRFLFKQHRVGILFERSNEEL